MHFISVLTSAVILLIGSAAIASPTGLEARYDIDPSELLPDPKSQECWDLWTSYWNCVNIDSWSGVICVSAYLLLPLVPSRILECYDTHRNEFHRFLSPSTH
ncbi:hypothetical protein EDD37DRAFT_249939 [Exophiala viscosa]|uniref:uncharacterized protein n=1 Tax=Exophiala viscosa TaxID=2486360 RepID=UPI002199C3A0|nr:hypothetical protein EDD37DRAFT_249939 [Exophiala viscosa]